MSQVMCPNCGVSVGMGTYGEHSYPSLSPNTLNSNNAIESSSHMRSQYSKTIAGIETGISKLDDEMYRLQMVMVQLAGERQSLERSLEEYRSMVAPIRRIPLDVLSEIFFFCADSSSSGSNSNSKCFDVTQAPLQLSFVCNKWRRLAISMSQLWSSISLQGGHEYFLSPGGFNMYYSKRSIRTDMLSTWLLRSGSSPLTLVIDPTWLEHDALTSYIAILIPHSHRWRDVTFTLDEKHWKMLSAVKGHLPQLEKIDVDVSGNPSDDYDIPLDIFEVAPKLHTITMQYNVDSSDWLVPWDQLKCLHFNLHFPMSLPWILESCPNLARCTVDVYRLDDTLDNLDHSSLASLHLIQFVEEYLDVLFNILTLRALRDLDIAGPSRSNPSLVLPQNAVASMLDRSSCNLQRLRLFCVGFTSDELVAILQAQPSLVELVIHEPTSPIVSKQLLERMTHHISQSVSTGSPLVVPNLKRLELFARFAFGNQVILDLIQSRWRGGLTQVASLESVKLGFTREVSSETIAQMSSWRKEGLNLEVQTGGRAVQWS
jgi:hypothetical protein